jgi:hypothetical protein
VVEDFLGFFEGARKRIQPLNDFCSFPSFSPLQPVDDNVPYFFILVVLEFIKSIEDPNDILVFVYSFSIGHSAQEMFLEVSIPQIMLVLRGISIFRLIECFDDLYSLEVSKSQCLPFHFVNEKINVVDLSSLYYAV